jgi:hypothetical protein
LAGKSNYLASTLTEGNNITIEIRERIIMTIRATYDAKKQLCSRYVGRQTKCVIYKTVVRPVLTYGNESCSLRRKDENMFRIFDRRILRKIYGQIKENGICRSRYSHEQYKSYNEEDTVKVFKVGRLRSLKWFGHLLRTQEQNPCRKLTLHKPEGTR